MAARRRCGCGEPVQSPGATRCRECARLDGRARYHTDPATRRAQLRAQAAYRKSPMGKRARLAWEARRAVRILNRLLDRAPRLDLAPHLRLSDRHLVVTFARPTSAPGHTGR